MSLQWGFKAFLDVSRVLKWFSEVSGSFQGRVRDFSIGFQGVPKRFMTIHQEEETSYY